MHVFNYVDLFCILILICVFVEQQIYESSSLSNVTPMSTSFFSNKNVNVCLTDNRKAYQLYFSSQNNTMTRSFTAEYENDYADCYEEGLYLDLAENPSQVDAIDHGHLNDRVYVNVGDIYEQVSYV